MAKITINRPEVRNAFNDVLIAELTAAFTELAKQDGVDLVVLAANGKSFCAGADLTWMKAMANYSYDENIADAQLLAKIDRKSTRLNSSHT